MKTRNSEWRGRWWLRGTPEAEVAGTLFRNRPPALELELLGSFDKHFGLRDFARNPLIVHGITTMGEELTIEIGAETSLGTSSFGPRKSYGVWRAISGGHFEDMDPLVASVTCDLDGLHEWIRPDSFDAESSFAEFPYGLEVRIDYREPDPISLAELDEFKIFAVFRSSDISLGPSPRSATLSVICRLRIDSSRPKPLSTFLTVVGQIQALISIATSRRCRVLSIGAHESLNADLPFRRALGGRVLSFYPVDEIVRVGESDRRDLFPHQMLFTLDDDRPQLTATRTWFHKWSDLGSVVLLFLGATQTPHLYQEHAFLNLAQALEGLHRATHSKTLQPKTTFKRRVATILAVLDESDRDLVRVSLDHANEPSLRQRLEELLGPAQRLLADVFPDREAFIKAVVNTRHYLSHFEPAIRGRAASGAELYSLRWRLSLLFECSLLLELGWPEEKVATVLQRCVYNRSYGHSAAFVLENRWLRT